MRNKKNIMVRESRFDCVEPFGVLSSLEMTAKQKEKEKAFSGGEAAAKRPCLSHAARVIPNAVRNLFKQLQVNDFSCLNIAL